MAEYERRQSAVEQAAQQSRNELKAMTSTEEELKNAIKEKEEKVKTALNAAREADEAKVEKYNNGTVIK